MNDLVLASRVRANLAVSTETSGLEVEVTAHAGAVGVKGKLASRDQFRDVETIVRKVPGVSSVKLDLYNETNV